LLAAIHAAYRSSAALRISTTVGSVLHLRALGGLPTAREAVVGHSAVLLALIGAWTVLAKALSAGRIPISHALAMCHVMPPRAVIDVGGVKVAIDVDRAVDVDVDVAVPTPPVPASENCTGSRYSQSERQAAH
jgi:hypothetical protein